MQVIIRLLIREYQGNKLNQSKQSRHSGWSFIDGQHHFAGDGYDLVDLGAKEVKVLILLNEALLAGFIQRLASANGGGIGDFLIPQNALIFDLHHPFAIEAPLQGIALPVNLI